MLLLLLRRVLLLLLLVLKRVLLAGLAAGVMDAETSVFEGVRGKQLGSIEGTGLEKVVSAWMSCTLGGCLS